MARFAGFGALVHWRWSGRSSPALHRRGVVVYRRGLERVAVHWEAAVVYGRELEKVSVHRRGAMVYGKGLE